MFWIGVALASEPSAVLECPSAGLEVPGDTKEAMKAAVRIETVRSSGSGVVVSPDGYVLTAAHVVGTAKTVTVVLADGSELTGTVVRNAPGADLALISLGETGFPCLGLSSGRADLGTELYLIGSPGGEALTHTLTRGITSGYREIGDVTVLQTDASVNPGASGGPILTANGEVVGIASFKLVGDGLEGLGFGVAVEEVEGALEISFGSESGEVEVRDLAEEAEGLEPSGVTVSDRPAVVSERLPTKEACKDVEGGKDPVTGLYRMTADAADLFSLGWEDGSEAVFTTYLRSNSLGTAEAVSTLPGAVSIDYVLDDGTKVHLVNSGGRVEYVPQYGIVVASVDFVLSEEAVAAFATSAPTFRRWNIDGTSIDQERSERQGERYYRPAFSCVMAGIEKYHHAPEVVVEPEPEPEPVVDLSPPEVQEAVPSAPQARGMPLVYGGAAGVVLSGAAMVAASQYAATARSTRGPAIYDHSVTMARRAEAAGWVLGVGGVALVGTGLTLKFRGGGSE